jgi:hypothetical protein
MTQTEEKILKALREYEELIVPKLKKRTYKTRLVHVPFYTWGIFNTAIWDTELQKFTKIRYPVGVGKGVTFGSLNRGAYYDEIKYKEFEI